MGGGSLKDLYLDELGTLYDAEAQMLRALPQLSEAAIGPELRRTLAAQCRESRLHMERIDLIFTHWGERRPLRASAAMAGIVQEADGRLNQETTPDARDAAIIGVAQRIVHYEIAGYGSVRGYAIRLDRWDEARLLQEMLDEGSRAENRLLMLAGSNRAAAGAIGTFGAATG
jgi:ferritin-like metal-binding protein YciE